MISIDKKKCIHTNCNGSWFLLAVGTRIVSNGGNTLKKIDFFEIMLFYTLERQSMTINQKSMGSIISEIFAFKQSDAN